MEGKRSGVVRRPVRSNTGLVQEALGRLADAGVGWSPRLIGIDENDEVLTWLPGRTLDDWWRQPVLLDELTRVIRQLHDTTTDLAPDHECLVHDDLQPRNVVVDQGRVGLIDWEQLRPGRRVEDVAQLCWAFMDPTLGDVDLVGRQWRRVVDVYGLVDRSEVVGVALAKIERCIDDIVRLAGGGSVRHERLLRRGDADDLALLRARIESNGAALAKAIR